jgi:hypothetical protein
MFLGNIFLFSKINISFLSLNEMEVYLVNLPMLDFWSGSNISWPEFMPFLVSFHHTVSKESRL